MVLIAIDPGLSGGIAWLKNGKVEAVNMPDTIAGIRDVLNQARTEVDPIGGGLAWHSYAEALCYVEEVHSTPQQGVKSVWTFGMHYGTLKAVLLCLGISMKLVAPAVWMKGIRATRPSPPKDASRSEKARVVREAKHKIKEIVESRFPTIRVTLKTSDALGILMYAMEKEKP